jgi:hypothetical protein
MDHLWRPGAHATGLYDVAPHLGAPENRPSPLDPGAFATGLYDVAPLCGLNRWATCRFVSFDATLLRVSRRSRQDRLDDLSVHVRQPEVAPLELGDEPRVVDSHQVKDRRIEVVDFNRVFDDVI